MFSDPGIFSGFPRLGDEQPCKDRALRLDRRAGPELLDALGITPSSAKEADIIRRLVMDLLEADYEFQSKRRHAPRSISYSRNISRYTGMSRYYGKTFNYKSMLGAVDRLLNGGFIYEVRTKPSPPTEGEIGHQSTITATGGLIEKAAEKHLAVEFVPAELIRLKDTNKRLIPYDESDYSRARGCACRKLSKSTGDSANTVAATSLSARSHPNPSVGSHSQPLYCPSSRGILTDPCFREALVPHRSA
jgi:hypothetical protein